MDQIENSTQLFSQGYNCSQSVFAACAPQLGLPEETALKIGAPFGAGIGYLGLTCGAVSGGLLVIGLKFGFSDPMQKEAKQNTYRLAREFIQQFSARWGSTRCKDLIGYDLMDPLSLESARASKIFDTTCPNFVRFAVELVNSLA